MLNQSVRVYQNCGLIIAQAIECILCNLNHSFPEEIAGVIAANEAA
jgi:hypothetical protein